MKRVTQGFKLRFVANRQMDVGGMIVGRATVEIGVFNGGVTGLNSLLREWDVAARDGVQVRLGSVTGNLRIAHDAILSWL